VTIWKSASVEAEESKKGIQIRLSKFFFFKSLSIDGAKISSNCEELEGKS
jgi:hypothetical protein